MAISDEELFNIASGTPPQTANIPSSKKRASFPRAAGKLGVGVLKSIARPFAAPFAMIDSGMRGLGVGDRNKQSAITDFVLRGEDVNSRKAAWRILGMGAETGLTAATLGTGTAALQGAKIGVKQGAKVGFKQGAKTFGKQFLRPREIAKDITLGSVGAFSEAKARGRTTQESLREGAFGGLVGAAAPAALGLGFQGAKLGMRGLSRGTTSALGRTAAGLERRALRFEGLADDILPKPRDISRAQSARRLANIAKSAEDLPSTLKTGFFKPLDPLRKVDERLTAMTGKKAGLVEATQKVGSVGRAKAGQLEEAFGAMLRSTKATGKNTWVALQKYADISDKIDRATLGQKVEGGATLTKLRSDMTKLMNKVTPDQRAAIPQLQKQWQGLLRAPLKEAVDAGRITAAQFEKFRQMNPNYLPHKVQKFLDAPAAYVKTGGLQTAAFKEAKGSTAKLQDSLVSSVDYFRNETMKNEQNKAARNIFRNLKEAGLKNFGIKEVNIGKIPKDIDLRQTKETAFKFWENGRQVAYTVPRDLGYALKNLDPEDISLIGKLIETPVGRVFLKAPASFIRAVSTKYNPEFALIRNPVRDIQQAKINSSVGLRDFAWSATHHIANVLSPDSKMGQAYTRAMKEAGEAGGILGTGFYGRSQSAKSIIKKSLANDGVFSKVINTGKHPLRTIDDIGGAIENNVRLSVYMGELRRGASVEEAAKIARQATADFTESGRWTKELNKIIPYLNARIRGVDSLIQAADRDPVAFARKTMYYGAYPAIVLNGMNSQYESYKNIPSWEKKSYWIIMTGEMPGQTQDGEPVMIPSYIKIPKGEAQQVVGSIVDRMLATGGVENPLEFASGIAGALSPVALDQGIIPAIAPTGIKIPFELAANINFFTGKAIERDYIPLPGGGTADRQSVARRYRVDYDTSEIAKGLAKVIPMSPAKIDHLVRSGYLNKVFDTTDSVLRGDPEPFTRPTGGDSQFFDLSNNPFLKSFIGSSTYGGVLDRKETELLLEQEKVEQRIIDGLKEQFLQKKDPSIPTGSPSGGGITDQQLLDLAN